MDQLKNQPIQKCSNKYCPENLFADGKARELCPVCMDRYNQECYCVYCQQVYFQTTDDGKNWIECEVCKGWVHNECANVLIPKVPGRQANVSFSCIKCKKLNDGVKEGSTRRNPGQRQPLKMQKKMEGGGLSAVGFQWALTNEQIGQDVRKMQQHLKRIAEKDVK